ncbi:MAG: acyl-CoA dehydrogenase family protein [Dehalococcoidia bacterium]|nr:acyl-CoA dehydrogenase family protein [Dehalococcoidia bacterium]
MDFREVASNEKMDGFRKEVRAWLEKNVPEEMKNPVDSDDRHEERYHFWREKNKELGAKGWLYPTFPKQYGGGGLSAEHVDVLIEEFHAYGAPYAKRPNYLAGVLLVWGTEEQRQEFLVPLVKGEMIGYNKYTEPHSGSDLASYQSTAVKDGDMWVLNGSNAFPGGHEDETNAVYFGPMLTDKEAPRHRNLGFFMVPYPTPGLTFKRMNTLQGTGQCFIYLDDVRVPNENLVGGDHQGWQVMGTALEQEHGGNGTNYHEEKPIDNLVSYMQRNRKEGKIPGGDPVLQQIAAEAWNEFHSVSIMDTRVTWMYHNKIKMQWEGPVTFVYARINTLRNAARIREVMGMYALLGAHDPLAPQGGAQEVHQRNSLQAQHGSGSFNISKVVAARRIGISRTREQAAPTPNTATNFGV